MGEKELLELWEREQPLYEAWGNTVRDTVCTGLQESSLDLSKFIKIPATPRTKDPESLRTKAFYREKPYQNPYKEITDKVGVRFVVLNTLAVDVVNEIISGIPGWDVQIDRDFEQERIERPEVFGYQSEHFLVSPSSPIEIGPHSVPVDTTCEIQVRSLTQHAWAETMHSWVYKQKTLEASPEVKRKCAQAVALTELLDQIYCEVEQEMGAASKKLDEQILNLAHLYETTVGISPTDSALNTYLLDAYAEAPDVSMRDLVDFFDANGFLAQTIRDHAKDDVLYRQPAILFIYYQASRRRQKTAKLWPFTKEACSKIYMDLGLATP
ncbi:hypothetical protein GM415_15995 [Pseudodesulfovibrio cashew]|uniref:RelA/SpoT domain-containing protein n=1 Tax=Pseudodesulfovibrio cashew TaxID=2678688 RepID=A0A6I6JKR1_9BACT|nr:RelA/SpoT domain-containing protein [Pseudodesulfovibrio cashew]QGY41558.1 hypothetical protein GM415_15995 [Pseudodesulfovibrio cashew]